MMALGPVVGKLRNNFIAFNRRRRSVYVADKFKIGSALNNDSMPFKQHKRSFPRCQGKSLTQDEQVILRSLYNAKCTCFRELPHRRAMNHPKITAMASFAVEEFNKQKNTQLVFVRAVKGFYKTSTLEAVDAHVVKTYQAVVKEDLKYPSHKPYRFLLFGLVADNGNESFLNLIDNRRSLLLDDRVFTTEIGDIKSKAPIKTKRDSLEDEILSSLHMLQVQK